MSGAQRKSHDSNGLCVASFRARHLDAVPDLQAPAVRMLRSIGCREDLAHAWQVTSLNVLERAPCLLNGELQGGINTASADVVSNVQTDFVVTLRQSGWQCDLVVLVEVRSPGR